jgi:hypothetical protein
MRKTQFLLATLAIAAILFTGCKNKKSEVPSPVTNNSSSTATEFFANNGAKKQAFTVNVDNSTAVITGSEGSTITIPKDAFMTASGQPVTGSITIELVEILDQVGMVLSDRPTVSNGQLLVSGGEIYIGATADGQQLELNDSTSILITLPADSIQPGMTLFTGAVDSSQFNWTVVPGVVNTQQNPADSIGGPNVWSTDTIPYFYYNPSNYIFSISNLGWINCDRFYNAPSTTTINISCNGVTITDNTNIKVYTIFKSINSVMQAWCSNTLGEYTVSNLPVGEPVSIVAFYLKDGKEYVGITNVTISANLSTTLQLTEASEAEIVALIKTTIGN